MKISRPPLYWFKKNSSNLIAFGLLFLLAFGLLFIQFRHPIALNMDGGNNASNVQALMNFKQMPFSGSPVLPFVLSAIFGFLLGSVHAGIKIISTLSIVFVGWLIFDFIKRVTKENIPAIAGLLGWCVSLGVFIYPLGYLKQTVALPFLLLGLISLYWIYEKKNIRKNMIIWTLSFICIILSHTPSVILFLASSFVISASMLPGSEHKNGKLIGWSLWGLLGIGIITAPWTVPFFSQYYVQLSLGGWRTMVTSVKGLFSHRYQMQVDFNSFDYLHLGVPVFGLARTTEKWRRLALWLIGFGLAVFLVALFVNKYEWQERNILTMFVPLSILVGLGFYHLSKLITKKKVFFVPLAILMALVVFGLSGYGDTVMRTVKLARPIINLEQLADLNNFLEISAVEYSDNLFARHGLRFWATYTTEKHCGVFYRHWDENYFAVRNSRGKEALPDGREPEKGDYILISKSALFPWEKTVIQENRMKVLIPTKAEEYLKIEFEAGDDFDQVEVILKNIDSDLEHKHSFINIVYGKNDLGWLLTDVPRGRYEVVVVADGFEIDSASLYIEENLLDWANKKFNILVESREYLVMEVE